MSRKREKQAFKQVSLKSYYYNPKEGLIHCNNHTPCTYEFTFQVKYQVVDNTRLTTQARKHKTFTLHTDI